MLCLRFKGKNDFLFTNNVLHLNICKQVHNAALSIRIRGCEPIYPLQSDSLKPILFA